MKDKYIKKLAESLRKKLDLKFNFSENMDLSIFLDNILEYFHIKIITSKDSQYKDLLVGKLFFKDKDNILLKLPYYTTPLRDNELKASKIYVVLLYLNGIKDSTYIEPNDIEFNNKDSPYYGMGYYAKRFALYFLMPTKKFNKAKKELNSIQLLAAKFQVSTDFVKERYDI